ncbi:MAG TPA: phosphotransferase [Miltoncostaeaceae bacterium]|nr:phosphotransferase [Miltoncostaeaceae bacterium]
MAGDLGFLDEDELAAFVAERRWFAGGAREIAGTGVLATIPIAEAPPLVIALIEVRLHPGTHEVYQLVLGARSPQGDEGSAVGQADGIEVYDALEDPAGAAALLEAIRASRLVEGPDGVVEFRSAAGADAFGDPPSEIRPIGREQSNSSIVFDDRLILKAYRRLEPGIGPEIEILRFLQEHEFHSVPALIGWYEHRGPPLDVTLGVLQRFLPDAADGWELAQEMLRRGEGDAVHPLVRELGAVTGRLHATLAADSADPAFAPEAITSEGLALRIATIDEQVRDVFAGLPEDSVLEEVAMRQEELRTRLRSTPKGDDLGRKIRIHGDYHLGQGLRSGDEWYIVDLEGEPARPISERRLKSSPLRDVAGMVRSFDYAGRAARILHGVEAPAGWAAAAREAFLEGYFPEVERTGILPASRSVTDELLRLFELEKAVYELAYEVAHRPEWAAIPAECIVGILDGEEEA